MVPQLDAPARKLWNVVRDQLSAGNTATRDAERAEAILAERRAASEEFFSSAAGQWDSIRAELFGKRADLFALSGLLDPSWTVGDLGCGTGQLTEVIAPNVKRVIAVDSSRGMLAVARRRVAKLGNVDLQQGQLESLPIESSSLDVAVLFLVLHYVAEPARVFAEAARALKDGGRLLVVDMLPHERSEYRERMGHVWQGFAKDQLAEWMGAAGFESVQYRALPIDPSATGPALFAASSRRRDDEKTGRRAPTRNHLTPDTQ